MQLSSASLVVCSSQFKRILGEARRGLVEDEKKKEHFFHSEIDGMKATSDEGEEGGEMR